MKLKILSTAAIVLALTSGAFAQAATSGSSTGDGNTDAAPSVLEDATIMQPFFSDSTMSTMKSDEEVKAAFNALPAEQQKNMKSQCAETTSGKYMDFCAKIGAM